MKLSSAAVIILYSALLRANAQTNCADKIGLAQVCVKECVDAPYTLSSDYDNKLLYCIDQSAEFNRSSQLENCCGMTGDCVSSMQNAHECLQGELADVKATALDYLTCVYQSRENGTCGFANFCFALLTGGTGTGASNDFSVAENSSLAIITGNAQTCSDMDIVGKNACGTVAFCCAPCADKIADVANAVTNTILLPTYNTAGVADCPNKTCAEFNGNTRQLETTDELALGAIYLGPEESATISEYNNECSESLSVDIAAFNTSYAAQNYFPCLYKQMDKIMAVRDEEESEPEEASNEEESELEEASNEEESEPEETSDEKESESQESSASGFLSGSVLFASAAIGSAIFAALA
eukprot:jgi/Psemu1/326282/estExt_fgenesh1_pg.C_3570001